MTLCTSHISVLLEANPRVASMPSNLCSVSSICVLTLRLRMSVFMLARSLTNRPSQPQSHDPVVCDHAAPVPLPVLIPACDGRIPRYVGTAALPHLPFSCIVIGSSPHLHNGRAPVILNVCPETLQEPDASLADPPDRSMAAGMVSTTLCLVYTVPVFVGNSANSRPWNLS